MSAELAARRTLAAALLADFRRDAAADTMSQPYAFWCGRLETALALLIEQLDAEEDTS